MLRGGPPFQYIQPPGIVRKMNTDVVGHEVEDEPDIMRLQRLLQPFEAIFAAEFRIELSMIDDVVAVGGAFARLHERRCVEMSDAERLQVWDNRRSRIETKIGRKLQAVRCVRNGERHQRSPTCQCTDHGGIRSPASSPQILLPLALTGSQFTAASERLACSDNAEPSPIAQLAWSNPSSVACALSKRAAASRGMISRRRVASRSRTSVRRVFAMSWPSVSQSSTADSNVAGASGSGISSPYFA